MKFNFINGNLEYIYIYVYAVRRVFVHILARTNIDGSVIRIYATLARLCNMESRSLFPSSTLNSFRHESDH